LQIRFIMVDQLSDTLSSLVGVDKASDVILMCETLDEASTVPHHPKKLAFLFSAMRHFAESLKTEGYKVRYVKLEDESNSGCLDTEVQKVIIENKAQGITLTEPSEWRLLEKVKTWQEKFKLPVTILEDTRFLCSRAEFSAWVGGKKQLRMEFFYREMRKKYKILLDESGQPVGGAWNYDKENRKPPKGGMKSPQRLSHKKDEITLQVLKVVKEKFGHHFGNLEPFYFAVTREQALKEAIHFVSNLLKDFGDYQDAMVKGEAYLYHSLLSCYINAGLLSPLELCQMAEAAYIKGQAPLNCTEGFIRQILGWREYVRGIYWHFMPAYGQMNYLNAKRKLPKFYWGAPTKMFCLAEAVRHTKDHAYSHHIQRLMVTGNFGMLAGIDVRELQDWYLAVYADAFEWVEMPNTLGMALFGDGGIMASKPYAASGKYIDRMSNLCRHCEFDPNELLGDKACPYNALYWNFLDKHEDKLKTNQRLTYMYATWHRFNDNKKATIKAKAEKILNDLD